MRKRLTAIILLFVMTAVAACSGSGASGAKEERSDSDGPGRYVQEVRSIPEQEMYVQYMKMLDNGILRIAGDGVFYDSADNGLTWEKADITSAVLEEIEAGEETYMGAITMKGDGTILLLYAKYLDENYIETENYDTEYKYVLIDPDGSEREVQITLPKATGYSFWEDSSIISAEDELAAEIDAGDEEPEDQAEDAEQRVMYHMEFLPDGTVIGNDWGNTLYQVDLESGEVIREYSVSDMDDINTFVIIGNQLLLKTWEDVTMYDLESGQLVRVPAGIEAYFDKEYTGGSSDDYQFIYDEDADILYIYYKQEGIWRLEDGGEAEAELLIDGSDYSLTNPDVYIQTMIALEDETFLASYSRDSGRGLFYYSYSATATGPEIELRIVSLQENSEIEQAAANFREQNPQCSVKYEYLMDYDSTLSLSETLQVLNTEIMAGSGPDILILDNMPTDTYIETGILEDLSDVMEEVKQTGNYFDNILDLYTVDGQVYGIPTRFTVPMMMGTAADLEQITDLASLAEYTVAKRQENESYENIIGELYDSGVVALMLELSLNAMMKEDGTIDEAALKEFIEQTYTIYRNNSIRIYQEDDEATGYYEEGDSDYQYLYDTYFELTGMGVLYAVNDLEPLLTGHIMDMDQVGQMFGIKEALGWDYALMPGMDTGVFHAHSSVAVNARGKHIEEAKAFVAFMLSEERQKAELWYQGFPVSIDAFEYLYEMYLSGEREAGSHGYSAESEDGKSLDGEVNGVTGTREQYEELRDWFAGLDTPVQNNATIVTAIRSEMQKCFAGKATTDETVDNIMQKINLYLSE